MKRYAAIIAGGAGERFWPMSRIARPKHLCDITGAGTCLLEQTFRRLEKCVPAENIFVVTNREQVAGIREACPFIPAERIVAEPQGRDTLAAVALCALCAENFAGGNADALVAVIPSDHVIRDTENFARTADKAFAVAESGDFLVTVGVVPVRPATGFGYIQAGTQFSAGTPPAFDVEQFHEKPDEQTAKSYIARGNFFWNAGMFFWQTAAIRRAVAQHAPQCAEIFEKIRSALAAGTPLADALAAHYAQIEKKSIDFAVMEKARNVKVVPATFDWDDVGTWTAIERHFAADDCGNVCRGNVFADASRHNLIFDATGRATVLLGAENLIVVHTPDATLICDRAHAETLKALVRKLPPELR